MRVIEVSGTPFETYTVTATTYPLSAVKLLVPVIPPTGAKALHDGPSGHRGAVAHGSTRRMVGEHMGSYTMCAQVTAPG